MVKLISKESKNTYQTKNGDTRNYNNYFLVAENGKYIQIKTAFITDMDKLSMLANNDIEFALIKKQSKDTYKNKGGKDVHYYNYYLRNQSGKFIQIKCCYDDYDKLDFLSCYEGNK